MRETMTVLYVHLVWATWDRLPLLVGERKAEVYRAIVAECAAIKGVTVVAIGGMEDHVHLLVDYPPTIRIADLVKQVKGSSSYLTQCNNADFFKWQGAYGAFTVSREDLPRVRDYIENQERHHTGGTTQLEYEII